MMETILNLSHTKAKQYFLKQESYCSIDMPKYFVFNELLQKIDKQLKGKTLSKLYNEIRTDKKGNKIYAKPYDFEDVNYYFL